MDPKKHWESVYGTRTPESVSGYTPHLQQSLHYVKAAALGSNASVIDVGGGESTLVDDLLAEGFDDITVLDISSTALEVAELGVDDGTSPGGVPNLISSGRRGAVAFRE